MEKGSIQSDQGSTKSTVLSLALGSTGCVGGADPFIWWHRSIQTFIQLPPHRDTSVFKIPARPLTAATESTGTWEPSRCQTLQVLVYGNGFEMLSSSNSLVPNKTFPDGSEEPEAAGSDGDSTEHQKRVRSDEGCVHVNILFTAVFYCPRISVSRRSCDASEPHKSWSTQTQLS